VEDKITYVLMAELANGNPAVFGIKVNARSWEEGIDQLKREMSKDQGRRLIEAIDLQILIRARYIMCPSCQKIVPLDQGTCVECNMNFKTPEIAQKIQNNQLRVVPQIQYQLKAFGEGSSNKHQIRPEHVVMYDIIPPDSPAHAVWAETAKVQKEQIRQANSKLKMPSAQETIGLAQDRFKNAREERK